MTADVVLKIVIPCWVLAAPHAFAASSTCDKAASYAEASRCLHVEASNAEAAMKQYLDASRKKHAANKARVAQIESSQEQWLKFGSGRCITGNLLPRDEDKHLAQLLHCLTRITRERTHQIWDSFLRDADGAPPHMPEPER
jgi:uncharacterized protein YecT (DUF1311 family)